MATSRSTRASPPGSGPSLGLGSIATHARCGRRFASLFEPERRYAPTGDAPFRLVNEVVLALRTAHTSADEQSITVAGVVDRDSARTDPPETLSTEEQAVFRALFEHYREAFGDDEVTIDLQHSGASQRRDSASGLFALSGRTDLVFRARSGDGVPTVRRIHARRPRSTWADPGYALLLRLPAARAANDAVLRVERVWAAPVPGTSESVVTGADVERFRNELLELVTNATTRKDEVEPGWWCSSCPVIQRCPAVEQRSFEDVMGALDALAAGSI